MREVIARVILRAIVFAAIWCVPALARAEARVVLRVHGSDAEAVRSRVARELELRGFVVVPSSPRPGADPEGSVLQDARSTDAVVAILVVSEPDGGASIDVVDRVTGKRLERSLPPEHRGPRRSMIALAVAELVDASLVELRLGPKTAAGEIAPPADLPVPTVEPPQVSGQVGAAAGVLWPIRSPTPVGVAIVEAGFRPTRRVAILAEGSLPLHALRSEAALGTIRTYPFLVGVRTDLDVLPARSVVRMDLQGVVTALALRVDFDAKPGARAEPRTVWTTAAIVGLRLHGAIGRRTTLGGSMRLVVPFEDIRIRFDRQPVQRLGHLWVGIGAGVAVRW